MRCHTEYLTFRTKKRRELVHLTPRLESILAASKVKEGMMLVSAMHITAGVFVNDNEPSRRPSPTTCIIGRAKTTAMRT